MSEPEIPTDETPIFACNLTAIDDAVRPRYNELVRHIRSAMRDRREIPNGYVFTLDHATVALPEAAEWISMERLCCPFLTLELSASGAHAHWLLTLRGPAGVKPLLDAEFPG
jgi:hypothetical protein